LPYPVGPLLCRLDSSAGRIEIAATGIDQLTQSVCRCLTSSSARSASARIATISAC
jgi:hypothetical protein